LPLQKWPAPPTAIAVSKVWTGLSLLTSREAVAGFRGQEVRARRCV
jgi:hypothetical protein